jgi:hypothetical protein
MGQERVLCFVKGAFAKRKRVAVCHFDQREKSLVLRGEISRCRFEMTPGRNDEISRWRFEMTGEFGMMRFLAIARNDNRRTRNDSKGNFAN